MFGDSPCGTTHSTVAGSSSMFGWATLVTSCWLAGVKGAQRLGLVGLTLPVQQLIQYLKSKKEKWIGKTKSGERKSRKT